MHDAGIVTMALEHIPGIFYCFHPLNLPYVGFILDLSQWPKSILQQEREEGLWF